MEENAGIVNIEGRGEGILTPVKVEKNRKTASF